LSRLSAAPAISEKVITLAAIGHPYMGDDAIAVELVEAISGQLSDDIELCVWANKDVLSIAAELLEMRTAIVLVDCANMGIAAGEYRWFELSECLLAQQQGLISTHAYGFADALALAQTLGFKQPLYIFAIQAEQYADELLARPGLSQTLKDKKVVYCHALLARLDTLNTQLKE